MDEGETWDAASATATLPVVSWTGLAWRFHRRKYDAIDPSGSLRVPGRYHRDWPALYLSLGPHVALAERLRHVDPNDPLQVASLNEFRLTRLRVYVQAVLDCCGRRGKRRMCGETAVIDVSITDLCSTVDFAGGERPRTQQIGEEARRLGLEGLLVPSCTRFSTGNLILFTDRLRAGSFIDVLGYEEPELRVER